MALKTEFLPLKIDFKKNQSDTFDEALPNWLKVSKKRFTRIQNKV